MLDEPVARGRVLVVDDDRVILSIIAETLGAEGYEVTVAADGFEALEYLNGPGARPEVIILDLMLPRMDGVAFALALEECGQGEGIPIVVVSGAVSAVDQARQIGASALVPKPFDLDDLVSTVERVMRVDG